MKIKKPRHRKPLPNGARAIMGNRRESKRSKDFFPTPPWATRALMEIVIPHLGRYDMARIWEPACGEGHMSQVLREYSYEVFSSDIRDYGCNLAFDFLTCQMPPNEYDWIITNPPFRNKTLPFIMRALDLARVGVAMFVRSQWAVEGCERYEKLFRDRPPTLMAFFSERVNLCRGRWDPDGTTATAYCWLVWLKSSSGAVMGARPPFYIPPGQRKALTRPDDRARFAAWSLPEALEAAE